MPEDDCAFATRLARYCARNPVALERLTHDRAATAVTYRSDKSEGTTAGTAAGPQPAIVNALRLAPTEASRRWAALLRQLFEVDPFACPTCHGTMRTVAFITQPSVIDRILARLRTRASRVAHPGARNPPSTRAPSAPCATRQPTAAHRAPSARPRRPEAVRGRSACAVA